MSEARTIAVFRGVDDALAALRARAEESGRSRDTIDGLCGWKSGQASKYLCDPPLRGLTLESLITMAASLGGILLFVEHEQSMQYIEKKAPKRQLKSVRANGVASMFNRRSASRIIRAFGRAGGLARAQQTEGNATLAIIASKGGKARRKSLNRQARKAIAQAAANVRWGNVSITDQTAK